MEASHPGSILRPPRSRTGSAGRRIAQVGLALLAGLFVGGALLLAEPFQHRCAVNLQVANIANSAQLAEYRNELMAFVWGAGRESPFSLSRSNWQVDLQSADSIQITLDAPDAVKGIQEIETFAESFLTRAHALNNAKWNVPDAGEAFLKNYADVLAHRLDEAQKNLDAAMSRLPTTDPQADHVALMNRWKESRGQFDSARALLTQAVSQHKQLIEQGEVTHATVDADLRRQSLLADADLQQDLKELETTLTDLKLHMLTVWQQSSAPLQKLQTKGAEGASQLNDRSTEDSPEPVRKTYDAIARELGDYREAVASFSKGWNAEFAAVHNSSLEADTSTLLDAYQTVKTLLNEFLFLGGNRLSVIRDAVHQLSRDPADDARHHLRQSDAVRVLAELQSAHHQFEFASGALDSPANFRLDSALRIARGLRRRVADRTRAIDEQLQRQAIAQAREEQAVVIASLDAVLRESRSASDHAVDELIAVQDRLAATAGSHQEFVSAVAAAELANNRLQLTRSDLDQAEKELQELAIKRNDARRASELQMTWSGVVQTNVNLHERLRDAGVGASVTFLAVLLGQILLAGALWPR